MDATLDLPMDISPEEDYSFDDLIKFRSPKSRNSKLAYNINRGQHQREL